MSAGERDCQLVVMGPFGRVDLSHVTGFDSRQQTASIRVDRIDGWQMAAELPKGWEGMFELERGSSAADDFIARIEAAYNEGGAVPSGTLYQYISESDGSTSTYQYDGAVFRLGLIRGGGAQQTVEFFAHNRRLI